MLDDVLSLSGIVSSLSNALEKLGGSLVGTVKVSMTDVVWSLAE